MKLPEFLAEGPLGEIHIKGHRIYLLHIVEDYNDGFTVEQLAEEFENHQFRFQILDEGDYADRDWRDDLKKLLEGQQT